MIQAKRGWICTVSIHLQRVRGSGTDTRHVESLVAVHDARGTGDNRYSGLPYSSVGRAIPVGAQRIRLQSTGGDTLAGEVGSSSLPTATI